MRLYDNYVKPADVILQKLREQNQIDLYPIQEDTKPNELRSMYSTQVQNDRINRQLSMSLVGLKEDIITKVFYASVLDPILEHYMADDRSYLVSYNILREHFMNKDIDSILREMKYKNIYLSEMASTINNIYYSILEDANKIKEGLTIDQVNQIEKSNIDDMVANFSNKVPSDITNKIISRIDKGMEDFIDHQHEQRIKLQSIYDKAREKMEFLNQAQNSTMGIDNPNDDQDLNNDFDVNNTMDRQENEEIMNNNNPKAQIMQGIKAQEATILSEGYNVVEALVRIMTESTYHNETMNNLYKKDYQLIIDDAKTMYTVLEALNTMCIEEFNISKIKSLLETVDGEMKNNAPSEKLPNSSLTSTKPFPDTKPPSSTISKEMNLATGSGRMGGCRSKSTSATI